MWKNIAGLWLYGMRNTPRRIARLWRTPFLPIKPYRSFVRRCVDAFIEWPLLILDVLFLPECIQTVFVLFKWNTRRLNTEESAQFLDVGLDPHLMRQIFIDDRAFLGPSWGSFAYVSFLTINYFKSLSTYTLVHEYIHIWQYHTYGSPYIYHALTSQWSAAGYDYGGYEGIKFLVARHGDITWLNFEQQGDVLADYYRLVVMTKRGVPGIERRLEDYREVLKPVLSHATIT